jgi:hypothetical protein
MVVVTPLTTVVIADATPDDAAAPEAGGLPTWRMTNTVNATRTGIA